MGLHSVVKAVVKGFINRVLLWSGNLYGNGTFLKVLVEQIPEHPDFSLYSNGKFGLLGLLYWCPKLGPWTHLGSPIARDARGAYLSPVPIVQLTALVMGKPGVTL